MNPAEEYNKIRRILFSTIHDEKKGFATAIEWLEKTYKSKLGPKGYSGMKAELNFYNLNKEKYSLTVAGDMGDHVDFAGIDMCKAIRFDVTTNLDFKEFSTYARHMKSGPEYRVALVDKGDSSQIDTLDLGFKECECGGFKIPFILLKDEEHTDDGDSRWFNSQDLMSVCNSCMETETIDSYSTHFMYNISELIQNSDIEDEGERLLYIDTHIRNAYRYFRKVYRSDIMAIATKTYIITDTDGGGNWTAKFIFKNNLISKELPESIDL